MVSSANGNRGSCRTEWPVEETGWLDGEMLWVAGCSFSSASSFSLSAIPTRESSARVRSEGASAASIAALVDFDGFASLPAMIANSRMPCCGLSADRETLPTLLGVTSRLPMTFAAAVRMASSCSLPSL